MPFKEFTSGEYVNAAEVQEYLMDQQVFIFSSASARDAAFASASSVVSASYPTEGMVAYIGSGSFQYFNGSTWDRWPP